MFLKVKAFNGFFFTFFVFLHNCLQWHAAVTNEYPRYVIARCAFSPKYGSNWDTLNAMKSILALSLFWIIWAAQESIFLTLLDDRMKISNRSHLNAKCETRRWNTQPRSLSFSYFTFFHYLSLIYVETFTRDTHTHICMHT